MTCSVPKIFGFRKWFEAKFGDLCDAHDTRYVLKLDSKWSADMYFVKGVWNRGYKLLAVASFLAFQTPYAYWLWVRD